MTIGDVTCELTESADRGRHWVGGPHDVDRERRGRLAQREDPYPVRRLRFQVQDMRFLGPDVAVMHAVGGTIKRGKSKPSPGRDSIQTLVATRQGHEWHIAAFQNARLRVIGAGRAFVAWTVSDLV